MKSGKSVVAALVVALLLLFVAVGAEARGGHGHYGGHYRGHHGGHGSHFSFAFGAPLYWGPRYYGPDPFYYDRRPIIIREEPQVYIQREPTVVAAPSASVWFYCPSPAGYYPYVPNCSQAWVSVNPTSVAPPPGR
jgi:hypothetical protein